MAKISITNPLLYLPCQERPMKELLEELAEIRRDSSTCTDAKIIDIMVSLAAKIAAIEKRLDDEDMLRAERLERQ